MVGVRLGLWADGRRIEIARMQPHLGVPKFDLDDNEISRLGLSVFPSKSNSIYRSTLIYETIYIQLYHNTNKIHIPLRAT